MNGSFFRPGDVRMAWFIAAFVLMLCALPLLLTGVQFHYAFSEEGPYERLSIAAWLFAALVILVRIRPLKARAWAFAMLYVAFAAREADWHKAFTAASILKMNYYRHVAAPLGEKIIAFIVAIAFIALLIYVGLTILRFLFLQGGWKSRAGFWLLLGTILVVVGKVIDRAPAVLAENYGIVFSPIVDHYTTAFEEGLEMLHPLVMAWSAWVSQDERHYLS